MPSWSDYPGSAISSGTRSAIWMVYGPCVAMYLGLFLAGIAAEEAELAWGASIVFIPLLPLLAIFAIVYAMCQFSLATLLVIPFVLMVLWFWLDEDHRLQSFFSIAILTSFYPSLAGMWGLPDSIFGVCALGVLPVLYLVIRFHPQILGLVAMELAPEDEDEEGEEEEGEEL